MNKIYLAGTLVLIILVSGAGLFFFKDLLLNLPSSADNPQTALFKKVASNPKDIEKYKTDIQKLAIQVPQATQSAQPSTLINFSNCMADKPIVKLYQDEVVEVKHNDKKTIQVNINRQILNMKPGQSYQAGPFKPGVYLYECKDGGLLSKWVSKKSGILLVEDKYSPQYQTFLDSIDKAAKARLALGFDSELVAKLKVYTLHDTSTKGFNDVMDWVRANAKESTKLTLINCLADPAVIKVTSKGLTIQNNDTSDITVFMGGADGMTNISAKQSVNKNKTLTNSVLTFSCGRSAKEMHDIGFVFYE